MAAVRMNSLTGETQRTISSAPVAIRVGSSLRCRAHPGSRGGRANHRQCGARRLVTSYGDREIIGEEFDIWEELSVHASVSEG